MSDIDNAITCIADILDDMHNEYSEEEIESLKLSLRSLKAWNEIPKKLLSKSSEHDIPAYKAAYANLAELINEYFETLEVDR